MSAEFSILEWRSFTEKQPTLQDTQDCLSEGITQNGLQLYLKLGRPKRMDYSSDQKQNVPGPCFSGGGTIRNLDTRGSPHG